MKENPEIIASFVKEEFNVQITNSQFFTVQSHSVIFSTLGQNHIGTILFIHGANSGPSIWVDCAILLAKQGYVVHCIALPGFGSSNVSSDILSLPIEQLLMFFSLYLKIYIESHTIRPVIIGHSMGGYFTASFAIAFPNLCKSFILVNSAGIFTINGNNSWIWAIIFYFGIPNYFTRKIGFFLNTILFSYYSYSQISDPQMYWNIANMNCYESFGDLIVSRFIEFPAFRWKLCIFPKLISADNIPPFAMIWGENDTIVPISVCNNLQKFSSKKTDIIPLIYIYDTWHSPMSKTMEFVDAITICINSVRKPNKISQEKVATIKNALTKCYASFFEKETEKQLTIMLNEICFALSS